MWQWFHRQVKFVRSNAELREFSFKLKDSQNIQESSLFPKVRYSEEPEKLVSRMMTNQISPHTSLISTWDNLKS